MVLGAAAAGAQGSFAPVPFAVTLAAGGALGCAARIRTAPASIVFLVFGPFMVLGAYYAQTRTFDLVPLLYALPAGCLVAALRGAPHRGLLVAAYVLLAAGAAAGTFVRWTALALLTAPLAWGLVRRSAVPADALPATMSSKAADEPPLPEAGGAVVYLVFGLLLAAGMLL